ncbi:MAG: hypothetical protein J1G30_04030 [Spirochaetales bacterium]|nr:hypothetical protein [Spirochaetales bacterium]
MLLFRLFPIIVILFSSFVCNAQVLTGKALRIFEEVYRLTEQEKRFLTETFSESDDSYLLDWYLYFCGEKDYRDRVRLRAFYIEKRTCIEDALRKDFGSLDVRLFTADKQKDFAESLNILLHTFFFKQYKNDADTFSEAVNSGYYNCVSSSILYMLLLHHFKIEAVPVQTTEHVFISVCFSDGSKIDVETTNAYGFDPGKKKEVLDELGQVTGFSYVKQKIYKNRFNISLKSLLVLPVHNRSAYYTKIGKHEEALRLALFLKYCRNDERGDSEFHICYYNLLADLSSKRDFDTELQLLYYYLENDDAENVRIRKMRFQALAEMLRSCNSQQDFERMQILLDKERKLCNASEKNDFSAIENAFYVSIAQFYYKNNRIEEAYKVISETADKKNKAVLLRNTFAVVNQNALNTKDFDTAHAFLLKGKKLFPDSQDFQKAIMTFWNNYLVYFSQKGDFSEALFLLKQESGELGEKDKRQLMLTLYNSYAYSEYKKEHYLAAAEICAEAYTVLGKEKIIMENMKVYYLNALKYAEKAGNLELKSKIMNDASVYFPNFPG